MLSRDLISRQIINFTPPNQ